MITHLLFFTSSGINAEVKYSLLSGDSGYFSLDEFSGLLRLERPLTPDTPPTFELKVKATDRGLPRHLYSIATVTVDVLSLDDYQPVFLSSEYTAQLPESFAVGSQVLSVSGLTRDGGGPDPVAYRIVSGNEDGRFLLDSRTGDVSPLICFQARLSPAERPFCCFCWCDQMNTNAQVFWLFTLFNIFKDLMQTIS